MTTIVYKIFFGMILLAGIFIGIIKGQEARNKWVTKKKMKYEANKTDQKNAEGHRSLIVLDDIEMSTYHR